MIEVIPVWYDGHIQYDQSDECDSHGDDGLMSTTSVIVMIMIMIHNLMIHMDVSDDND